MVLGVGVDMVYIPEMERMISTSGEVYLRHTFTEAEIGACGSDRFKAKYYAGVFAAKEAVFKALGHLTEKKLFDFRCVEIMHYEDGKPYVNMTAGLKKYMRESCVDDIQLSITDENEYAMAFAIVQRIQ